MLQKLSEEIRECLRHAEECRRRAKTALNPSAIQDYLEMEQRWLALARSYEFTERLSAFVEPFRHEARDDKQTPLS
jgi:predicted transcriptional regulator